MAGREPKPSPRPPAGRITQAELDALYADRRQARASLAGTASRLRQVSAERDRLATAARSVLAYLAAEDDRDIAVNRIVDPLTAALDRTTHQEKQP